MNALEIILATVEPTQSGAALQALLKRLGFRQYIGGGGVAGYTDFGLHRFYVQHGVTSYAVRVSIVSRGSGAACYNVEFFGYDCSLGSTSALTESGACRLVTVAAEAAQEVLDAPDTKTGSKLAKAAAKRMGIKMSYHLDGVACHAAQLRGYPA